MWFAVANPDAFAIAHHFGHRAAAQLAESFRITSSITAKLREEISTSDAFFLAPHIEIAGQNAAGFAIDATLSFAASMEAIEALMQTRGNLAPSRKRFASWKHRLVDDGLDASAFTEYLRFKSLIRDDLLHGKAEALTRVTPALVHDGMRNGWEAWRQMAACVGMPHDEDSWQVLCGANGLPPALSDELRVDIRDLLALLYRRHMSGMEPGGGGGSARFVP